MSTPFAAANHDLVGIGQRLGEGLHLQIATHPELNCLPKVADCHQHLAGERARGGRQDLRKDDRQTVPVGA